MQLSIISDSLKTNQMMFNFSVIRMIAEILDGPLLMLLYFKPKPFACTILEIKYVRNYEMVNF